MSVQEHECRLVSLHMSAHCSIETYEKGKRRARFSAQVFYYTISSLNQANTSQHAVLQQTSPLTRV